MTQFWLSDPMELFQSFNMWPFNLTNPADRGNAMARLLFVIVAAALVISPVARTYMVPILLMFLLVNVAMAVVVQDKTTLMVPKNLPLRTMQSHIPDRPNFNGTTPFVGNAYNNPMPFDPVSPPVVRPGAPLIGERYGNMTEPSDGYFFNTIPDPTLQARPYYNPVADQNYWMNGGDYSLATFGPIRGALL